MKHFRSTDCTVTIKMSKNTILEKIVFFRDVEPRDSYDKKNFLNKNIQCKNTLFFTS